MRQRVRSSLRAHSSLRPRGFELREAARCRIRRAPLERAPQNAIEYRIVHAILFREIDVRGRARTRTTRDIELGHRLSGPERDVWTHIRRLAPDLAQRPPEVIELRKRIQAEQLLH